MTVKYQPLLNTISEQVHTTCFLLCMFYFISTFADKCIIHTVCIRLYSVKVKLVTRTRVVLVTSNCYFCNYKLLHFFPSFICSLTMLVISLESQPEKGEEEEPGFLSHTPAHSILSHFLYLTTDYIILYYNTVKVNTSYELR